MADLNKDLASIAAEWQSIVLTSSFCVKCLEEKDPKKLAMIKHPFTFGGKEYIYIGCPACLDCHKIIKSEDKELMLANIAYMLANSNTYNLDVLFK